MDYHRMTAPCGRDCFNCPLHLAQSETRWKDFFVTKYGLDPARVGCEGCRAIKGDCLFLRTLKVADGPCAIHECAAAKAVEFCHECADFPCPLLQPLADGALNTPHNLKVYNLCLIRKLGVEEWAKTKAKEGFDRYFNGKLKF